MDIPPSPGGYSPKFFVGVSRVWGPNLKTCTLFRTKICVFPKPLLRPEQKHNILFQISKITTQR